MDPAPNYSSAANSISVKWLILPISLIIVLVVGFILGQKFSFNSKNISSPTQLITKTNQVPPIIKNQSSTIFGKVTKVEGLKVTIVDDKQQSATLPLSSSFVVYATQTATTSGFPKGIELNKQAVINLQNTDGNYKVSSISYFVPPPPPVAPKR